MSTPKAAPGVAATASPSLMPEGIASDCLDLVEDPRPLLDAVLSIQGGAVLLLDAESRVHYLGGPAAAVLIPHSGSEPPCLPESISTFAPPFDSESVQQLIDSARQGRPGDALELRQADSVWHLQAAPFATRRSTRSSGWVLLILSNVTAIATTRALLDLYAEAMDESAAGIVIADATQPDLPVVHASDAFLKLTGYAREEVLGRNCRYLQGPETSAATVQVLHEALEAGRAVEVEILNYRKDGSRFWNHLRLRPLNVVDGRPSMYLGTQEDVTEAHLRLQAAHRRAHYDPLTGLPNRLLLESQLSRLTSHPATGPTGLWLLFLDLDGFKAVNDKAGHATGDELLVKVAERLTQVVRADDLVARLGGDEFVILLTGSPPLEVVLRIVDDTLRTIRQPYLLSLGRFEVAASLGIATWPNDADAGPALLNAADQAMYMAKERGRDHAVFYDPAMEVRAQAHRGLHQAMSTIVRDMGLAVRYKPVVQLDRGVVAAAAFLGWKDKWSEAFLPRSVMSVAEQSGELSSVGEWLLTALAAQRHAWGSAVPKALRIGVNIPLRLARDSLFLHRVESLPAVVMDGLDMELPAAALQYRDAIVARLIDLASNRGARIVIREFGSTSLSVGELLRSSIDVVKPDPHLLLSDLKAPRQAAALAGVIELGKAAGAIIQAEGVETAEQRDWLLQHGCQLMQGPFFSTALAAEEFPDFCLHYRP